MSWLDVSTVLGTGTAEVAGGEDSPFQQLTLAVERVLLRHELSGRGRRLRAAQGRRNTDLNGLLMSEEDDSG